MIPLLFPFKQVGDFLIGSPIAQYLSSYPFDLVDMSNEDMAPSLNYSISHPSITLFVSDNRIDFIGCYEELLYHGVNLIGISISHFSVLVGQDYVEEDKLDFEEGKVPQYVYEYPHIGLQVWARGKLGLVISIMVNGEEHYLD
ncbi:hypothetical protein [Sphingobacterium anhuiense]|uniref:Uncharacterized protein n=1 Tax=Sphingobacterium anhuiense TaxID=493780 RepID=A0ABW5YVP8_9SPHI